MRKVREVLRLRQVSGLSYREIAVATGVGHTAATEYAHRASVIGITWLVPDVVDDTVLDARLFGLPPKKWRAFLVGFSHQRSRNG